ncbi:MAG: lysylphosphatidylglycerol synthase transmembrane domain-containing protein [Candidatus Dormiibacterota bacterium]
MPIVRTLLHLLRRFWAELLACAGLVALVIGVNPARLGSVFSHIQWLPAALMIPVVVGVYASHGTAWWFALRAIGEHIGLRETLVIEFAGQAMVFLPLGDLTRVVMVRAADHEEGVGAITATVALQELTFMFLMSLGALPQLVERPNIALLVIAVIAGFLGVFVILLWEAAYVWAIRLLEVFHFFRRFDSQLRDIRPAFLRMCRPRPLCGIVGCQALAAALSFLLFSLALDALGANVSYTAAIFTLGVSFTVSAISFLPLGLGAFEGVLTLILLTYGVPAATGAAAGLLFRGYNDVLMAIVAVPCFLFVRRQQRSGDRRRSASVLAPQPASHGLETQRKRYP